jgi:hypothetical protein
MLLKYVQLRLKMQESSAPLPNPHNFCLCQGDRLILQKKYVSILLSQAKRHGIMMMMMMM